MPVIRCNSANLYYEERGAGQPIVFLHGVLCSHRYFEPQLARLSNDHLVVAVDFRGHGRSEKTDLGHTVAQYARDLDAVLDELDLTDVVVVGWSLGALVSWDYVDQFGTDRIRGLVNVDMEASRFQWDDYEYGLVDVEGLTEVLSSVQEDQAGFIEGFADQAFSDPSPEMERLCHDESAQVPAPIRSAILFSASVSDYRSVLPRVDVPMLVCAGAYETRGEGTVEAVNHVADLVPDARFELFEESGHCPPLEAPERFNQVVSQFVETL